MHKHLISFICVIFVSVVVISAVKAEESIILDFLNDPDIEENMALGRGAAIKIEPDLKPVAVKYGIIGIGQGGSMMANTFYDKFGYRRVIALNTNSQDFKNIRIPLNRLLVCESNIANGGAGKDPAIGAEAFNRNINEITSLMRNSFGDDIDRIIIAVGAGGGTGTGMAPGLITLSKDYLVSIKKEPKVGVMVSMPKKSESGRVHLNAYNLFVELEGLTKRSEISPLIISDNQAIHDMFPSISVRSFWPTANKLTVGAFDAFNVLAAQKSDYTTFDTADYSDILNTGVLLFGATRLSSSQLEADLADGLRKNLNKTLGSIGFDLTKATHSAGIITANEQYLSSTPQRRIDEAFATLEHIINPSNPSFTLHQGVYETNSIGTQVYTMIGGLEIPEARLNEMKKKAGINN